MIIPKNPKLTDAQLEEVTQIVAEFGCRIQVIEGAVQSIYAIVGDERHELLINRIEGLEYIDRVSLPFIPQRPARCWCRVWSMVWGRSAC